MNFTSLRSNRGSKISRKDEPTMPNMWDTPSCFSISITATPASIFTKSNTSSSSARVKFPSIQILDINVRCYVVINPRLSDVQSLS